MPGSWRSSTTGYLIQDRRHRYDFAPLSDNVRGTAAWRAHVTLIWHRPAPVRSITEDLYLDFAPSCAEATGGGISAVSI